MTQNSPVPTPDNPENQIFTSNDLNVNGQNYSGLDQLPPELQAKVKTALSKLQGNPNLANMLGAMSGLAKSALQNGIGVSHSKTIDHQKLKNLMEQTFGVEKTGQETVVFDQSSGLPISPPEASTPPSSFESTLRPTNRNAPMPSSTYNPAVKGDGLRKAIFIIAIALAVGYLVFKFGYNGQLPF